MQNKLKSYLPKGEFAKNVLTLMTGTTIAQAISIVATFVITRIYEPEDLGIVALFISITTLFSTIANGRYELALVLPKKDEDAINIFALGFIINVTLSLVLLLIIVFFHDSILVLLYNPKINNSELDFWIYFVPLVVFIVGFYNLLNYFNNRMKNYKDIALSKVIKSIVLTIVQLSIGFLKKGATGLFTGQIVSNFFANTTLLKNIIKDKKLLSQINKERIFFLAKKYKKFPSYLMLSSFLNTLSLQSINILISSFYSIATLGFYSLVNRLIGLPTSLIGGSIAQVFFQEANREYLKTNKTEKIFLKTFKKLVYLSIPIFGIMYFIVEPTFVFAFGEKWQLAGVYAKIMVPLAAIKFISSSLSTIITIHQKLFYDLLINSVLLVSTLVVFFIGRYLEIDFKQILIYYVIIVSTEYALFLLLYFNISKKSY